MSARVCYVSVAGNLEPEIRLPQAVARLRDFFPVTAVSRFYRTPAIGRPEQPDYLNGAVRGIIDMPARVLKETVLRPVETALGRVRSADKYAARTVDLDILIYGEECIEEPDLVVPDPDIFKRPFLAAVLLDIDPDLTVPGMNRRLDAAVDEEAIRRLTCDEAFSRVMKEMFVL